MPPSPGRSIAQVKNSILQVRPKRTNNTRQRGPHFCTVWMLALFSYYQKGPAATGIHTYSYSYAVVILLTCLSYAPG